MNRDIQKAWANSQVKYEAEIENYLFNQAKKAGALPIKFNPTGNTGVPDVIIFFIGFTWLVEVKTPGGIITPHQKIRHKQFLQYGHRVRIVRTPKEVDDFITDMLQCKP